MAINTTTVESNLTTKLNATSGTTDAKEFLLLGKAVEALTPSVTVTSIQTEGTTQVGLVTAEGTTQVAAVQAAASGYAPLANPTFTGTVNAAALTLSGDLTVNGTQTILNTATLTVDDLNITVADGAADAAAANGAGITVDGAGATFNYASSGDKWTTNKGLAVGGTLEIEEVIEKVTIIGGTGGSYYIDCADQGVVYHTLNQASNSTINFRGNATTTLDALLGVGQSLSMAVLYTQSTTAYYPSAIVIDGVNVTPNVKWQGGSAPTAGTASGIDVYTFTIIKTASATFTVLATVAAFA
jgi:hypothetical protein